MKKSMRWILAGILSATLLPFISHSQGRVSGIVTDSKNQVLAAATVSLIQFPDSVIRKTAVTGKDGSYVFETVSAGDYRVAVSASGFESSSSDRISLSAGADIRMNQIRLPLRIQSIANVTVTAKRPFIETKIDKTIVNVDASPTSAGATALEVLEKSPGITVSNDGSISLRGKAGVIVMMDGKPTYLSPADLANLLKNLPASAIDQIEIMTNPSSKYDASGNAGIINIRSKKGRATGLNGSVTAGITTSFFENTQGVFYVIPKSQNSLNLNYRKNKWNLFGSYNPNFSKGMSQLRIERTKLDNNKIVTGYNDVETQFKFGNNNHTIKAGADFSPTARTTVGFSASGFLFNGHPTPRTVTTSSDEQHVPVSVLLSLTNNKLRFRNLSTNLNFRHQFDSAGMELTADADYITYQNVSDMQLATTIYDGAGNPSGEPLLLRGHLPSSIHIYSFKSDFTKPLAGNGKIEAGVKSSFVSNDNLVNYERQQGGGWLPDNRSNHFVYDENINAVYLNAGKTFGAWTLQGGLRLENTEAKGHQITNDSTFRRSFTNLFPSAFISYAFNKQNTLTLSYSRRITRPNYQDLNPFIYFLDSLSYRKGNPFLLPQFTQNAELSYALNKIILTANYNHTTDVISQLIRPDGNILYLTAENISELTNTGISVTAPVTVTKWWTMNLFGNVFRNQYKGIYEGNPLDMSYTSFMLNMTQSFTVKPGFTAEVSGFYRAKNIDQLSINNPMYMLSFGLQKQVLKGKGTVRLNLRDPFWLQRYSGVTQYDLVDTRTKNRWDNRQITTSFTWRFGKTSQAAPLKKRGSASQDEQNRVGNSQ